MRFRQNVFVIGTLVAFVQPAAALAQDNAPVPPTFASRVTVSAALGYAYPIGSTERGNDTRDVSFGLVPLSLTGAYDLGKSWSTQLRVNYAANIPTLCSSGSDCIASLGHDFGLQIGIGRVFPQWRSFTAQLELYFGWEWLSTRLTDSGVTASRSWNGPSAALDVFVDLRSRGPWSFGPAIGVSGGVFTHYELETPAGQTSGATTIAMHAWPRITFRIGRRL
jgi:hypothetical protein